MIRGRAHLDARRRVLVMMALLLIAAAGLTAQLLRIQVFDNERYVAWGEDQRLTETPLLGKRGEILDRNGEELAISLPTPFVFADPLLVGEARTKAAALAPVLGRSTEELHQLLASAGRFVYLQRPTTEAIAEQVRALDLDGIFIGEEPKRFHPAGDTFARGVLGTVGVDGVGISGLEAQHDAVLAGTPGRLVSERGLDGRTIPEGERESLPAVDGADIELTIDRALQFEVEQTLREHVAAAGAEGGTVIIAEPATGDVLAVASMTTLDNGTVVATSENRSVTWAYEPASVMKAVTFGAVLNEGHATPNTGRVVSSELQLYEETFTDDEVYEPRRMTVTDILVRSSNTGTISWAQELGETDLDRYLHAFGFGQVTGLGFPGESSGILERVENWPGTHIATIAIGQSIAVTPMQMLAAYNVLANGGLYVAPRLIKAVGGEHPADVVVPRRVVSSDTAEDVTDMLALVVDAGTARAAQVPGYAIAAKTGTARKVQESGGYRDAAGNFHYIATVAGFFPAEDPQFSMIVIVDEPATEIYTSRIAAPLFGELAAWTLRHYHVSPAGDVVFDATTVGKES